MKIIILLAIAGSAIATPALAQVMTPSEYVMVAGASDLYERTSAQLVLETSRDAKVREFAQMMLTAHTQSTEEVKIAAIHSHVRAAPPMLTPTQTELIAELRAESGTARDAAYIAQQKSAHGQALSAQEAYANDGTAPSLKAAAMKIVPMVQQHIMMLKAM